MGTGKAEIHRSLCLLQMIIDEEQLENSTCANTQLLMSLLVQFIRFAVTKRDSHF